MENGIAEDSSDNLVYLACVVVDDTSSRSVSAVSGGAGVVQKRRVSFCKPSS